jgi:predicted DNA-binding transcriptional regulator YafY
MTDTTLRQLKLLEYLPRQPRKVSPQEIKESLLQSGFEVSIRTIQRDLKTLSAILPLISDERDKPYGWSWHKDATGLNPAMDPIEALTFSLAEEYLEPIMPGKSFKRMKIFFERANNVLKEMDKSSIKKWRDNVRVIPQWQTLMAPSINEKAEAAIYEALLKGQQLEVKYLKRGEVKADKRTINPLGIVLQGVIHRLICTMAEDPESPRHLPIHRFKSAEWNGNNATTPKDFNLDGFIKSQNIGFLVSKKPLSLEVIFEPMAGFHLTETPISKDQILKQLEDGRYLLKVKLPDTSQLRWWLLGFGGQIEIIRPVSLRKEFKETGNKMTELYK